MRRYYSHKLFCSERKLRTRKKEANTWPWAEITKFYEAYKLYQAIQWQVFPQSFDDPGPLGAASQKFKQEKVEYLMRFLKGHKLTHKLQILGKRRDMTKFTNCKAIMSKKFQLGCQISIDQKLLIKVSYLQLRYPKFIGSSFPC